MKNLNSIITSIIMLAVMQIGVSQDNLVASNVDLANYAENTIAYLDKNTTVIRSVYSESASEEYSPLDDIELQNHLAKYKMLRFTTDGANSQLHIKTNSEIQYTEIQILEVASKDTVLKSTISEEEKYLDINDIPQGEYYFILSNDEGDIHSEKLLILN